MAFFSHRRNFFYQSRIIIMTEKRLKSILYNFAAPVIKGRPYDPFVLVPELLDDLQKAGPNIK